MLDAYLGGGGGGDTGAAPGGQEVGALQAIGLGTLDFATRLRVPDTGFVRVAGASVPADSLASGNYVFGVDVFRRSTTQFLPILSGPVPPDYRLGPGDQLVLIITGDIQRSYILPVERQGFILIPQVGQVFVSTLTLERLRDVLYDRLGQVYSKLTRAPNARIRFDVTVASVRANQISVVGEVEQPGAYQISALGTALTALYAAGGVTARANMRQIDIRRLGKSVATLDLYDYLLRGDTRNDIRLETGDVVFVPLHGRRVQLTGAVLRPAIYELKEGETLVDLVRAAGGFRANALTERVAIHRILPAGQRALEGGRGRPPAGGPLARPAHAAAPLPDRLPLSVRARCRGPLHRPAGTPLPRPWGSGGAAPAVRQRADPEAARLRAAAHRVPGRRGAVPGHLCAAVQGRPAARPARPRGRAHTAGVRQRHPLLPPGGGGGAPGHRPAQGVEGPRPQRQRRARGR